MFISTIWVPKNTLVFQSEEILFIDPHPSKSIYANKSKYSSTVWKGLVDMVKRKGVTTYSQGEQDVWVIVWYNCHK